MGAVFSSPKFEREFFTKIISFQEVSEIKTVYGFENNHSTAIMFNNSVSIAETENDFLTTLISGAYSAASSASTLYNNSVYISGGNFISTYNDTTLTSSLITGAFISPRQWREVDVASNKLITPDGTTVNMQAYDNTVTITGGTIYATVAGATIAATTESMASLQDQLTYNGTISNNTVNIYGGTIKGTDSTNGYTMNNGIYGGVYQGHDESNDAGTTSATSIYSVTNNTVNIGFNAKIEGGVQIGGGAFNDFGQNNLQYFTLTPNVNTYDGNTLNINQLASTQSAGTIANFENINFVLGAENTSTQLANTALITSSDTLYLGNGYATTDEATTNNGTVATKYANFGLHTSLYNTIATGDEITLLTTSDIDGNFTNLGEDNSGTYTGTHGALLSRTWQIDGSSGDSITAKLLSTQAGEQSKILGEVSLANMTAITNSTDLLVGSAIPTAYEQISSNLSVSAESLDSQNSGLIDNSASAAFMVTSGGSSRYNTGSHVDSNSISLNAGIAKGAKGMSGNWLVGGFFEYNYGNYSTYNSFSTGTVEGDGEVYAFGLGGFARYDFEHAIYKPYLEASLRLGYIETDYSTADLNNYSAETFDYEGLSYDVNNMYVGAHVGVGNVFDINEKLSLDASLKYFWTHQFSENRNLFGHNVDFDAVNSHRVRLHGRASYILRDDVEVGKFAVYGGLGLEYEFDGKARSVVDGYEAPTPDLQGFTGLGEFGLSFTPKEDLPLNINLGVNGFVGMREGVSASLQFVFKF